MFKELIRTEYFKHLEKLIADGAELGKVVPFDDEYYSELSNTLVNTIPVDLDIKYLKPKTKPGKCYDRSLRMFMAMENSVLVRGSINYFRLKGATNGVNHGWVERDGYVYDPTFKFKFDKDLYYKIFKVKEIEKRTKDEYVSKPETKKFYEEVKNTTLEDYKPNGSRRYELLMTIPLLQNIAKGNKEFLKELDEYLEEIEYDEDEINEELNIR